MKFHETFLLLLCVLVPFCCCFLTDDSQSSHHDSTGDLLAILVEEKDLRHQLAEAVTQMKSEFDVLKSNFTSLQNENAVLKKKLESIENDRQHQLQSNNTNQSAHQVLFSVYLNNVRVLPDQPIVFNYVLRNKGGGYRNGTFHCPIEGEYMFSLTLASDKSNLDYKLFRNNETIAYLYTSGNSNDIFESGTVTFFTHVEVGDRIWVKSPSDITYYFSYFSGLLVSH